MVGDVQRTMGTLDEWNTAVAAYGEATADGNIVLKEMGYQHLFDAAILQVVLDRIERAEDDTLYALEILLQAEHVKKAVDVVQ